LRLKDKTAIVTGGTSGIGRKIAERFAEEGAPVIINGRNKNRGKEVVKDIISKGGQAIFIPGDVTDIEINRKLVNTAVTEFGSIDILSTNAGMLGIGSISELSVETWKKVFDINVNSVFYLIKTAFPHMLKNGGGSIVVTGSIAALTSFPNHSAYCASKGALISLVRQLATDLAPQVRINIISPGQVDTPLFRNSVRAFPNPETIIQERKDNIPLKRLGFPDDIANVAIFLASDESCWITGSALTIDGGFMSGV
jgi:NAD(P)-dependent dehydrogenase (short-subunit alcohol dehydrogenase family)